MRAGGAVQWSQKAGKAIPPLQPIVSCMAVVGPKRLCGQRDGVAEMGSQAAGQIRQPYCRR